MLISIQFPSRTNKPLVSSDSGHEGHDGDASKTKKETELRVTMSVVCQVCTHRIYTRAAAHTPVLSFPGEEEEMKEFWPQKEYLQLKIGPVRAEKRIREGNVHSRVRSLLAEANC